MHIFSRLIKYGDQHINDEVKVDYFAVSLPNLLVFEDDLNIRNKAHCHFIQGLGYLGLGEIEEAGKAFSNVLKLDPEHLGAKTHINMPIELKKV
jgi:hypothetical protein